MYTEKKAWTIWVRRQKQNSLYGFPCWLLFFFFVQRMMLLMTPVHKSIKSPHRRHTLKLGLSFCHFNNAMHFIGVWPNLWRTDGEQEWKTGWKKNDKMNAYPYSGVAIVQQHADKIIIAIILLMMMMKTMESYATLYPRC